jgi:hypothetical protein
MVIPALIWLSGSLYVLGIMKLGEGSCPGGFHIDGVDLPGAAVVGA